jgi:hypothetical protein
MIVAIEFVAALLVGLGCSCPPEAAGDLALDSATDAAQPTDRLLIIPEGTGTWRIEYTLTEFGPHGVGTMKRRGSPPTPDGPEVIIAEADAWLNASEWQIEAGLFFDAMISARWGLSVLDAYPSPVGYDHLSMRLMNVDRLIQRGRFKDAALVMSGVLGVRVVIWRSHLLYGTDLNR